MLTHPERLVIVWVYASLAATVLAAELLPGKRRNSPWSFLVPLITLPLALILGTALAMPTTAPVMWLINDCSVYLGGPGHFDEDVFFAHAVTLSSLAWVGLTGYWHRRQGWHNWAGIPPIAAGLYCSLACWEMVFSFRIPGCCH